MSAAGENIFERVKAANKNLCTEDDVVDFYRKWADVYEDHMAFLNYCAPTVAARYLAEQNVPRDGRILDVAAGSGLVGTVLQEKYGYTNIDAHDGSAEMLEKAGRKNIYKNLHCCFIGDGRRVPVADNTYDAAIMVGGLVAGHVKCNSFEELIRIVKPGGIILNAMREVNTREVVEYQKLHDVFAKLVEEGKWKCIGHFQPTEKFFMDFDALVHIYRVV